MDGDASEARHLFSSHDPLLLDVVCHPLVATNPDTSLFLLFFVFRIIGGFTPLFLLRDPWSYPPLLLYLSLTLVDFYQIHANLRGLQDGRHPSQHGNDDL